MPISNSELAKANVFGIGDTPLFFLNYTSLGGLVHNIALKLEGTNPFGSIKDRTALALVYGAMRGPGAFSHPQIVESTSGNLGKALSAICQRLGIGLNIVVDSGALPSRIDAMRSNGAIVRLVPPDAPGATSHDRRIWFARNIAASLPGAIFTNQYENPLNYHVHRDWTAPELLNQSETAYDAIFVTASSGGTAAGFSKCLRMRPGSSALILVDSFGSNVLEPGDSGSVNAPGFGSKRQSSFFEDCAFAGHIRVDERVANFLSKELASNFGIYCGASSAGLLLGALDWLEGRRKSSTTACVLPDGTSEQLDVLALLSTKIEEPAPADAGRLINILSRVRRT